MKKHPSLDTEAKAFLRDYLAPIPNPKERQRIKEALQKITAAAEQRVKELKSELESMKEQLRQERERRNQAEEILRKREPLLTERVKEISCLYSIVNLMGERNYPSEEEKLKDIVRLVPTGWHCPQDACARITLWGKDYKTDNFQDTPWKQASSIIVNGEPAGTVAVGYLKEIPIQEEGPFLLEERTLIDVMARLIGEIMGPKLASPSSFR
jgi:flagellar motor protein MotB